MNYNCSTRPEASPKRRIFAVAWALLGVTSLSERRASEVRRTCQPVEKVDIELIATTNRDRNAPRSAYSVPTLGPMRAPREFFNRLTPSTHFGE